MTLRFFEGPAGSGKTTRLFSELELGLEARPLEANQRVLALTKMHGSRRRMESRLRAIQVLHGRHRCITVDSFAWGISRRWRTLARRKSTLELAEDDYDQVCSLAGQLLSDKIVSDWITRAYGTILVDEFQDSKGGQLQMIRALADSATCIVAADEFQDLDADGHNNQAVALAREIGRGEALETIHRTAVSGLLEAARAIREGSAVPPNGNGFTVLPAHNHNAGAGLVSKNLSWWWNCEDIAILTPVRPSNSPFVRQLIARVEEKPIGDPSVGPYRVPWEESQDEEASRLTEGLALPNDSNAEVRLADLSFAGNKGLSRGLRSWIERQIRIAGRTVATVDEIQREARRIHQRSRAHRIFRDRGVRAMTIHQAKNREFHSVIVLWPYEVAGSTDRLRRLLYNAVTRARHRVVVVVQNPQRLQQPPFTASS